MIKDLTNFNIYNEIEDTVNQILPTLNIKLLEHRVVSEFSNISESFNYYTSIDYLNDNINDIPTSRYKNFYSFKYSNINQKLIHILNKHFKGYSIIPSGSFIYPENGFMSWHTNSNAPYDRIYIVYSDNGDSFFKYYDNGIVTDNDNVGINIRYFSTPKSPLFWHCVGSQCMRYSFGYRLLKL